MLGFGKNCTQEDFLYLAILSDMDFDEDGNLRGLNGFRVDKGIS